MKTYIDNILTHATATARHRLANWIALTAATLALPLMAAGSDDARSRDVQPVEAMVDGGLREAPDIVGRMIVGSHRFPIPEDTHPLAFPNADMAEVEDAWPMGWKRPDPLQIALGASLFVERHGRAPKPAELAWQVDMPLGQYEFVVGRIRPLLKPTIWQRPEFEPLATMLPGEAPGGLNALRITDRPGSILGTPKFEVESEEPYMLSFWTRNDGTGMGVVWNDLGLDKIAVDYLGPPETDGQWKRAGYYFRARQGADQADLFLVAQGDTSYIDVAGFELRSATEEEYSRVYEAERAEFPDNVTEPEPGDGKNLTLSKAKLSGAHGLPDRPFVVWAIGSSWTNGLGRGEDLRQMVREVYPDAPKIVYKVKVGSGTPYDSARGWAATGVVADQPDLVVSYTGGTPEALEEMLRWIRSQTTADVIIPSLHFTKSGGDPMERPHIIDTEGHELLREICERYGAQFVENRRELYEWLEVNDKKHTDLLSDGTHQNRLGSLLTNENIWRHLLAPIPEGAEIESERVIDLPEAFAKGDGPVEFSGEWAVEDGFLVSQSEGAALAVTFEGNRMDVLGEARPGGGQLRARVNGKKLRELPAFAVSMVHAPDTNLSHGGDYPRSSEGAANTGPHGVLLGENVVPQDWRIEMIDEEGHYRLIGSKTGVDGVGRSTEPFVSDSGQIRIEPRLWRFPTRDDGIYRNQPGDHWTFSVTRAVVNSDNRQRIGRLVFDAEEPTPVDERLFYLAPVDTYEVHLSALGGPVALSKLVLYDPPVDLD